MKVRIKVGDLVERRPSCTAWGPKAPPRGLALVIDVAPVPPGLGTDLLLWEDVASGERGEAWEDYLIVVSSGS